MTSTTRKTATANPYKLPPSLLTAMSALGAALDGRAQADTAIDRNGETLAAASAELPALVKRLDDLDVQLAMEIDPERAEGLEDAAEGARNAVADADRKVARLARVQHALVDKAIAADAAITEARTDLKAEKEAFGRECLAALDTEMAAALATAVAPVLARAHALRELGVIGWGAAIMQDIIIPGPNHSAGNLLSGSHLRLPSGETVDLASNWRQFADPATCAFVGELPAIERRAAAHQAFVPPAKAASTYQPNQQNVRANERNRAIEAREAANPPKPWNGQSWRGTV
jgi:hypothetical protein